MGSIATYKKQPLILPHQLMKSVPFTVIGLGGIGSPVGMTIGKMGAQDMELWDADTIERHNLPNQFYRLDQLEQKKAEALAKNIRDYAQVDIVPITRMYTDEPLGGIVISGVDKIEQRKIIWEGVKRHKGDLLLYIECRMAAEFFQIFPVVMNDARYTDWYEARLNNGKKPSRAACTEQTLFFNVMACAGYVGEFVKKFLMKQPVPYSVSVNLHQVYSNALYW